MSNVACKNIIWINWIGLITVSVQKNVIPNSNNMKITVNLEAILVYAYFPYEFE